MNWGERLTGPRWQFWSDFPNWLHFTYLLSYMSTVYGLYYFLTDHVLNYSASHVIRASILQSMKYDFLTWKKYQLCGIAKLASSNWSFDSCWYSISDIHMLCTLEWVFNLRYNWIKQESVEKVTKYPAGFKRPLLRKQKCHAKKQQGWRMQQSARSWWWRMPQFQEHSWQDVWPSDQSCITGKMNLLKDSYLQSAVISSL